MIEIANRIRQARTDAGFATASDAVKHFNWTYSTYAGHENGHRSAKLADLKKYAAAFGVDFVWLQTGRTTKTDRTGDTPKPDPRGFAEQLPEFLPPTDRLRLDLERLAQNIAPTARRVTWLLVPRPYPSLLLMAGDVVLVNLDRVAPDRGEIAVCQIWDEQTGAGSTQLMVFDGNQPLPAYSEPALPDTASIGIMGCVISSLRGLPGAQLTAA